jgi:hypothetical protein
MDTIATILFVIAVFAKWLSVKSAISDSKDHYDNLEDFEKMKGE